MHPRGVKKTRHQTALNYPSYAICISLQMDVTHPTPSKQKIKIKLD